MNQSLSTLWGYVNRNAYPILFVLFALWMCIGIFPLVCYETDSMEVILGCDLLYDQGWQFPPIYCYEYRMQPLTVITVVAWKHLMPFLTCEQIYCLMTALASFIFLIGCIEFARHITKESRAKILIAAMLLPEMYAIAMYPNSAIPAAACFIWAFINIIKERHWLTILLMCIAPLFRVDVVIVYPAILPLLLFLGKSLKKSLILSAIYGVTVVAVGFLLFYLLGADVLSTVHGYHGYDYWNDQIESIAVLYAIIGFYSLSYFILLLVGTYNLFKQRMWKELFLILLPIVLIHFVYHSMGCASKHYLYIAPFVILAGIHALSWICNILCKRQKLKWIVIAAICAFFLLSVKRMSPNNPWLEKDFIYNNSLVTTLYSTEILNNKVSIGLGTGKFISTADEYMFAYGQFFYSWFIHSYKSELEKERQELKEALDNIPSSNIMTIDWGPRAMVIYMYMAEPHQISYNEEKDNFILSNAKRSLTLLWSRGANGEIKEEQIFERYLKDFSANTEQEDLYVLVKQTQHRYYLESLSQKGITKKVTEILYKVNTETLQ